MFGCRREQCSGAVTIACAALALFLAATEVSLFTEVDTRSNLIVDTSQGHQTLEISFDVDFLRVQCKGATRRFVSVYVSLSRVRVARRFTDARVLLRHRH